MFGRFKIGEENNDEKVKKLHLSKAKNDGQKGAGAGGNSSSSSGSFHAGGGSGSGGLHGISVGKKGVQVAGKTLVVTTKFNKSGYNNRTGKTVSNKQLGGHAAASLSYMNQESRNTDLERDEELSNVYNKDGRMTNEELKEKQQELEEKGAQAFRRTELSPGQDLSREEMETLVRNTMQRFEETTGKSYSDYQFAIHTNTKNVHAHINIQGDKQNIEWNREQLQTFKVIAAEETRNLLNDRVQERALDRQIERESKHLERLTAAEKINQETKSLKSDLRGEKTEEVEKLVQEKTKDISFSKAEIEQIKEVERANGYLQHLQKNEPENGEKIQNAERWKAAAEKDMSYDTHVKYENLKERVEEIKGSKELQDINDKFKDKRVELVREQTDKVREIGLTKEADRALSKEITTEEKTSLTNNHAVEAKEHELENDKHLTHAQQIDKQIDGKLDNKHNEIDYDKPQKQQSQSQGRSL